MYYQKKCDLKTNLKNKFVHLYFHFLLLEFSCACSLLQPHCSGCPFPSLHLKELVSVTQGQARERDSRAVQNKPQDKRQFRQPYSGRSARQPGLQRGLKAKLPRPTIQFSETIVTSQPWLGWQVVTCFEHARIHWRSIRLLSIWREAFLRSHGKL